MPPILRISEAASLALHTMQTLALNPGRQYTTHELAKCIRASENHLSKVLQRLAKVGLVRSIRGPKGGFRLDRDPREITLLQVFEAIEGPMEFSECLLGNPVCAGGDACLLGGLLSSVNQQVKEYLSTARLSQLGAGRSLTSNEERKHEQA